MDGPAAYMWWVPVGLAAALHTLGQGGWVIREGREGGIHPGYPGPAGLDHSPFLGTPPWLLHQSLLVQLSLPQQPELIEDASVCVAGYSV